MAVKNAAPITVAVDKLNARTVQQPHQDALQARTGTSSFESRVVQETGVH